MCSLLYPFETTNPREDVASDRDVSILRLQHVPNGADSYGYKIGLYRTFWSKYEEFKM